MKPSKQIARVKYLLQREPETRDNDNILIAQMWYQDLTEQNFAVVNVTAFGMLDLLSKGKLTNTESIRRCRQMLQKEFKELRGNNYNKRHKEKENVLKDLFETPEFYKGGTP